MLFKENSEKYVDELTHIVIRILGLILQNQIQQLLSHLEGF
jgi:hypothetical protein